MAPSMFIMDSVIPRKREELRTRYEELEKEVREGKKMEGRINTGLERTKERLRMSEEAEERLCSELGDLEAEAVAQARLYNLHIKLLSEQLPLAHKHLHS